jgi:hypothetical protein
LPNSSDAGDVGGEELDAVRSRLTRARSQFSVVPGPACRTKI